MSQPQTPGQVDSNLGRESSRHRSRSRPRAVERSPTTQPQNGTSQAEPQRNPEPTDNQPASSANPQNSSPKPSRWHKIKSLCTLARMSFLLTLLGLAVTVYFSQQSHMVAIKARYEEHRRLPTVSGNESRLDLQKGFD
ncbi:hypothetical protein AnigIFM50267_001630 [Aspergillus niger]|nr:hypothetical protein AnigIFM50267_001630 [Aspergillus niger]